MAEYRTERLRGWIASEVVRAAALLRSGGTVAFPTETVYGLGANALDAEAVARIFRAKERPAWDPLIVHVSDREMLRRVAVPLGTQRAERLMGAFWPGPLTLLLPRTPVIPDSVTAGRPLVGVRMPLHPAALELIRLAGVPVAAPSANRFGRISPTTAAHVLEDLDGRIEAVLDGGPTEVGLESTVLDPAAEPMLLYRQGAVTVAMIEALCGAGSVALYAPPAGAERSAPESLPSPGVGLRHYAPRAPLLLVEGIGTDASGAAIWTEAIERAAAHSIPTTDPKVGVMLPAHWSPASAPLLYPWGTWDDGETLARRLFAGLRMLDEGGATVIVCPLPSIPGIGAAIRDRLEKASRVK